MTTMLSPHFTLEEMTASQTAARLGLENVPPYYSTERANLRRTAETLELVRSALGDRPILISSGYRSPAVNAAVGGSSSSAHMIGLAVDFTCPGYGDPIDVCRALVPYLDVLEIDQLIHEYGAWVHLGLAIDKARCMALTIDNSGTRHGFA
jgi:zinc D-Ala-D-Ala carboxypeptidase